MLQKQSNLLEGMSQRHEGRSARTTSTTFCIQNVTNKPCPVQCPNKEPKSNSDPDSKPPRTIVVADHRLRLYELSPATSKSVNKLKTSDISQPIRIKSNVVRL
jgi:hypothetical protein